MDYRLTIDRMEHNDKQTLGTLSLYSTKGLIENFDCLELTKGGNEKMTRIPAGFYKIERRYSKKFGQHFILKDVEERSYILLHTGNTYHDTRGCILVGNGLGDINNDGYLDILHSRRTMDTLLLYNIISLEITDESTDEPIYLI